MGLYWAGFSITTQRFREKIMLTRWNKFGQRQSKTPFSSVFWFVDLDLISKYFILICPEIFCAQKVKVKNLGSKKILVQKNALAKKQFCQKCLNPNLLSKNIRSKNVFVTTPTTTQHNLNTVVGLDMKMALPTNPPTTTTTHHTKSTFIDHNLIKCE